MGTMGFESDATAIWRAGVDGVDPYRLLTENTLVERDASDATLWIAGTPCPLSNVSRVIVVGAGKATAEMARGLEDSLGSTLKELGISITGLISIPEGSEVDLRWTEQAFGRPAGINEPTIAGVNAARRMLEMVRQCGPSDVVIALISGGASALLPLPIDGITLEDKLAVTRHLSAAGADIESLNTVRKQLSGIKGGRLASACKAPVLLTLVLSDILGDPLPLIGSGPTIPDTSTPSDALRVLQQFDPERVLPESVYRVLDERRSLNGESRCTASAGRQVEHEGSADGLTEECPESPLDSLREVIVLGNNAAAVDAAGIQAEALGYRHAMVSSRHSEGAAEELGRHLAEVTISMLASDKPDSPNCLISGGEPTVKLVPQSERGKGGRNQQLVLSAFCRFLEEPHSIQEEIKQNVTFLSAGTDGEDGPTNAAGAILNARTWQAFQESGLDPVDYLRRNDAYVFFEAVDGLLISGPTGTNVCDLRVIVCRSRADREQ